MIQCLKCIVIILILISGDILFSSAFSSTPNQQQTQGAAPILIGMTTALSGPAQDLGQQIKTGIEIYFARVNSEGGIAGRKLVLIVLDDKYEPTLAAINMRQLIEKDHVLATIGNVGTPTAMVTVPIANETKTLLFGAFSGALVLRKTPPDRYVINLRASYEEETAAMINGLLSAGIKPDEIAFFIQNDSFGDAGYAGAMKALKAIGFNHPESLPVGRYTRNTLNVEEGLARLISATKPPKAIIIVGAYAPSAKFIQLAKEEFPKIFFLNVSFVGSEALAQALGQSGDRVIVTQVVPYFDSNLPAVIDYLNDLNKYGGGAKPSYVSLEGYLDARLFVLGLREAASENKLTREGIIDVFENMHDQDIGIGIPISFDKMHHQALHAIWPTLFKNKQWVQFKWGELQNMK